MAKSIGKFPHISRSIPRILSVLFILSIFVLIIVFSPKVRNVKGVSNTLEVTLEIERTLNVITERPDYAGAWNKLSVLYEQVGERELAREAREIAAELNPDF